MGISGFNVMLPYHVSAPAEILQELCGRVIPPLSFECFCKKMRLFDENLPVFSVKLLYWYKLSRYKRSRSLRTKINFREYKLSRMAPFKNIAGINFRDRLKFW